MPTPRRRSEMYSGYYEEAIAWVYSKLRYPSMRGWKFCVGFYAREGSGTRREIFFATGYSRQRQVQGLLRRDAEIIPGAFCSMTDSTRVGMRHSAAILGCVLRLSQRIEVTWRQTKHRVLGKAVTVEVGVGTSLSDFRHL
jgi:hypothetical protein